MKILQDILKFRHALNYGYYNDERRPLFAISFDEAMDLWLELRRERDRKMLIAAPSYDLYGDLKVVEVPREPDLPEPVPGQIWGQMYGVRIYVEEL